VAKKKPITIAGLKRELTAVYSRNELRSKEVSEYITKMRNDFQNTYDKTAAVHAAELRAKDEEIAKHRGECNRAYSKTYDLEAQLRDSRAFFERIVTLMAGGKIEEKKDADAS
jgi:hypothetical protein